MYVGVRSVRGILEAHRYSFLCFIGFSCMYCCVILCFRCFICALSGVINDDDSIALLRANEQRAEISDFCTDDVGGRTTCRTDKEGGMLRLRGVEQRLSIEHGLTNNQTRSLTPPTTAECICIIYADSYRQPLG